MRMIIAVIQPTRLRAVQEALTREGVSRFTICDCQELAGREDRAVIYRGRPPEAKVLRKAMLEIAVNDDFLEKAVQTILSVARTGLHGNDGDGKVFVLPLDDAYEFFPEKRGKSAL